MALNLSRVLVVWFVIVAAETLHGIVRNLFIAPALGDLRSRQVGVFVGSGIIFAILYFSICWIGAKTNASFFVTGLILVVLTLAFEISLGAALGLSFDRIGEDYDASRGGLMIFGMLFLLTSPMIASKLRKCPPG